MRSGGRSLAVEHLQEHLRLLRPGNRVAPVEDESGHAADAPLLRLLFVREDLRVVPAVGECTANAALVHVLRRADRHERLRIPDVDALLEIRPEQRTHRCILALAFRCKGEQRVRRAGVGRASDQIETKGDAERRADLLDVPLHRFELGRVTELRGEIGRPVHAALVQVRVQLEGQPAHVGMRLGPQRQCGLEALAADIAPGADEVGVDFDLHGDLPRHLWPILLWFPSGRGRLRCSAAKQKALLCTTAWAYDGVNYNKRAHEGIRGPRRKADQYQYITGVRAGSPGHFANEGFLNPSDGLDVTAHSLKTKYALAALGIGALVALLLAGMLLWQYRMDSTGLTELAQSAIEPQLVEDLQTQANRIAQQAALRLAPSLHEVSRLEDAHAVGAELLRLRNVAGVEIRNERGDIVFSQLRPSAEGTIEATQQILGAPRKRDAQPP